MNIPLHRTIIFPMMKTLVKFSTLAVLLTIILASCQKNNVDAIISGPAQYNIDTVDVNPLLNQMKTYSTDTIFIDCIRIPLPINFLQSSGNVLTINSEADLLAATSAADSVVDFIYPFPAIGANGPVIVNDIADLILGLQDCGISTVDCSDQDPHVLLFFNALNILTINKYEYSINYPVSMIVDGNNVTLNKDDDYLPAIGGSPFNYKETFLVYPISLNQFGRTITLNDDNDVCLFYESLSENCGIKPAHIDFFYNEGAGTAISCTYFIDYPVNIVDFNGNSVTVNSPSDYQAVLNASPNAYAGTNLVYPVTARKYSNNQLITFNSDADLCQYLNNCR